MNASRVTPFGFQQASRARKIIDVHRDTRERRSRHVGQTRTDPEPSLRADEPSHPEIRAVVATTDRYIHNALMTRQAQETVTWKQRFEITWSDTSRRLIIR